MVVSAWDMGYNNSSAIINRPWLNASDVIPNANFALDSGQTACWGASVTIADWVNGYTAVSVQTLDNGQFLTRVANESSCNSTAGTYFVEDPAHLNDPTHPGDIVHTPNIHVHPFTGSPITNAHLYEFSSRSQGLVAAFGTAPQGVAGVPVYASGDIVDGIETSMNYDDSGSLYLGGNNYSVRNVLALNGGKHNALIGTGSMIDDSVAQDAYYGNNNWFQSGQTCNPCDSTTLWVSAGNDQGTTTTYRNNKAIQSANVPQIPGYTIGGATTVTGYYGHAGPGLPSKFIFQGDQSIGMPDGSFAADTEDIEIIGSSADGGIGLSRGSTYIINSQIHVSIPASGSAGPHGASGQTDNFYCSGSTIEAVENAVQVTSGSDALNWISNGCTYISKLGTGVYQFGGTTGNITLTNNYFQSTNPGGNSQSFILNGTPNSFKADWNHFSGAGSLFTINGTNYNQSGYLALTSAPYGTHDTNSLFTPSGCFTLPCNIGNNGTIYAPMSLSTFFLDTGSGGPGLTQLTVTACTAGPGSVTITAANSLSPGHPTTWVSFSGLGSNCGALNNHAYQVTSATGTNFVINDLDSSGPTGGSDSGGATVSQTYQFAAQPNNISQAYLICANFVAFNNTQSVSVTADGYNPGGGYRGIMVYPVDQHPSSTMNQIVGFDQYEGCAYVGANGSDPIGLHFNVANTVNSHLPVIGYDIIQLH
jgi:hypothetical protein